MPDAPRCLCLLLSCFCTMLTAACTAGGNNRRVVFEPVTLTRPDDSLAVVVYGNPLDLFEGKSQSRSWLDELLYGPVERVDDRFRTPQGLAAVEGRLYICDQGWPDVVEVDLSVGRMQRWTVWRDRPACPIDVTVDDKGYVYVADATRLRVLIYNADGQLQGELEPPRGTMESFRPTAVLAKGDTLYVADSAQRRIERYDLARDARGHPCPLGVSDALIPHPAGRGRFRLTPFEPVRAETAIGTPTGLAMTTQDVLLVADALGGVVHRVDQDGQWLEPIGSRGRGAGQLIRPMHVCCTPSGLVLVTDAAKQAVVTFDEEGRFLFEIVGPYRGWKGWTLPSGVAWIPRSTYTARFAESHPNVLGADDEEWIIVSDMLAADGLTLLSVRRHRSPE